MMIIRVVTIMTAVCAILSASCSSSQVKLSDKAHELCSIPADLAGRWINEGEQVSLTIEPDCRCFIRYTEWEEGNEVVIAGRAKMERSSITLRLDKEWWYGTTCTYEVRKTATHTILWLTHTDSASVRLPSAGQFGFYKVEP